MIVSGVGVSAVAVVVGNDASTNTSEPQHQINGSSHPLVYLDDQNHEDAAGARLQLSRAVYITRYFQSHTKTIVVLARPAQ